jgi:hypothetical protein
MVFSRFHLVAALVAASLAGARLPMAHADEVSGEPVLRTSATEQALNVRFTDEDAKLLEEIQHGCFLYFWNEVGAPSKLAKDRRHAEAASVAGVGFQLSALPIGVEHGWITKEAGRRRALTILRTLRAHKNIRRDGVHVHFVRADDGEIFPPFKNEISTVDHSLFLAGALPAATYFGGEVAELVDQFAVETNWRAFAVPDKGFLTFAWKPNNNLDVHGDGQFMPNAWHLASDEERLIYFMAVGSPTADFALDPRIYYQLERHIERHGDMPPYVVSWNGALFTYFFSHSWIDYASFGADDPRRRGVEAPRVDWFENSRRATLTHRQRCVDASAEFSSFAPERWGVSPCMGFDRAGHPSYLVQDVEPNLSNRDQWQLGTIAPYAAGSAIVFTPQESMAALRAFRELKNDKGEPLVWRDPADGGYALADSFNLDSGRVSDDNVAIDVGPMLLAIENARTRLIWRLFMEHPHAKRAVERLQLKPLAD